MKSEKTIRLTAIVLHAIVLLFGIAVVTLVTGLDVTAALAKSAQDLTFRRMLEVGAVIILGNLAGLVLICSPLFKSKAGLYAIVLSEIAFLGICVAFLSIEYSVAPAVAIICLLAVAKHRYLGPRTP